ncbi:uncharacterized protein LOC130622575 [Hydractinia symbiolongicarpus]|uniref:uncharacterized protein LOC130622575 n=1 Tax=Hydractinia symbiolongicarpus TaxID=13093 RepID=UPI00254EB9D4|nr:uncharacterized protein LOC130622575 [Hydractinia symbiolongicarpus]
MMTGYIRQKHNLNVSQKRVVKALTIVSPANQEWRRTETERLLNPVPYQADYFGHKLHIDQNEKVAMYGVTHVVAIDGHTRYVTAGTTMAIKNNVKIHENIYRKTLVTYGIPDQLRVDCGREFYLILGMQEHLALLRGNQAIECYRQTESKQKLPIKRFWVEVNCRVNHPLETVLVFMANEEIIDMSNDCVKFCVSFVSCLVASYGLQIVISSWNNHPIPGRGVPSVIKTRSNGIVPLMAEVVPNGVGAKLLYMQWYPESRIASDSVFGVDRLFNSPSLLSERMREFESHYSISDLFGSLANETIDNFREALLYFINLTRTLQLRITL